MSKATGKLWQDKFCRLAKAQGYRSRAAFKLLHLDIRFRFLPTARAVLDLGAAPGGWVQVAVRSSTVGALVVGVDLKPIRPIRGARLLREDITATAKCSAAVRRLMDSKGVTAFDVVLHDGVGQKNKRKCDGAQEATTTQSALVIDAVRLATTFLAPKGTFITKLSRSQDLYAIMFCLKQLFVKVQASRPIASRTASAEIYVVCLEYKAPAKIQPELFDLNHLFTVSLENKPRDEVRHPMESESRGICSHGSIPYWRPCPASEFVWFGAKIPQELVDSIMTISFDDPASLPIKNHELTTVEIRRLCEDFNLLDKDSLSHVLEWRTRIREALSSCSQVTSKADFAVADAKVKEDDKLLGKKEELTSIIDRKTRRDKSQLSCRANDKARKTMGMQMYVTEDSCCNADIFSACDIKDGKELRAIESAEVYMEDGIGDSGKEGTLTHEGSDEEMESDEGKLRR